MINDDPSLRVTTSVAGVLSGVLSVHKRSAMLSNLQLGHQIDR